MEVTILACDGCVFLVAVQSLPSSSWDVYVFYSTEWLRSDSRRTAVGVDLDLEALNWCMENNINKVGADGYSRISLFHGNVLQPFEAKLVRFEVQELISNIKLREHKVNSEINALESTVQAGSSDSTGDKYLKRNFSLPARDIVCAFNYSCCCLHKRADLVLYFKHVLDALSKKGGIFVMDLYGGTSSERKLRLQRRFPNFTVYYICSKYHGKIIAYMGGPQVYIGMPHFPFGARFNV